MPPALRSARTLTHPSAGSRKPASACWLPAWVHAGVPGEVPASSAENVSCGVDAALPRSCCCNRLVMRRRRGNLGRSRNAQPRRCRRVHAGRLRCRNLCRAWSAFPVASRFVALGVARSANGFEASCIVSALSATGPETVAGVPPTGAALSTVAGSNEIAWARSWNGLPRETLLTAAV